MSLVVNGDWRNYTEKFRDSKLEDDPRMIMRFMNDNIFLIAAIARACVSEPNSSKRVSTLTTKKGTLNLDYP